MQQLYIPPSVRVLRKIVPIYESNNKEELYSKIGAGIVDLKDLDKVLKVNATSKILKFWTLFINKKEDEEGDDAENPEPNSAKAEESATAGEPQFVMAECCKPIPGDSVVGYKDPASHRIIVHKSNCKELDRLAAQFGRNILKYAIKWSQHKAMSYLSTIELRGIDRTGILLDLAKTVSEDFSINIRQINIQTHDNIFEGTISLYVKDAEGLHAIMDKIRKIKGIDTVKRNQDYTIGTMDEDIIQILWSALLIVIVTIAPLVKKFKEMQRKELRSASAARPVRQADADTSAPASGFRKTNGKSPKTEKTESPLRNQTGLSRADAEQHPHRPGLAEEYALRTAVRYSEIMAPKFKEE